MKLQKLILAAALIALAAPLTARGDFIPPNLPAGSKYEIAFVTSGGTTATDQYIADYNAFVTAQAAQNPNLPQGVSWHAIASTFENFNVQDAIQNAPFTSSIPVYNTQGQLLANAAHPLYSPGGFILNSINYDQFGQTQNTYVWTGSALDGTFDNPLGNGNVYGPPDLGRSDQGQSGLWCGSYGFDTATNIHPLYALSSPITVPEPSTIVLLLVGLIVGAAFARRRAARVCHCSKIGTLGIAVLSAVPLPVFADFIPPNLPLVQSTKSRL